MRGKFIELVKAKQPDGLHIWAVFKSMAREGNQIRIRFSHIRLENMAGLLRGSDEYERNLRRFFMSECGLSLDAISQGFSAAAAMQGQCNVGNIHGRDKLRTIDDSFFLIGVEKMAAEGATIAEAERFLGMPLNQIGQRLRAA